MHVLPEHCIAILGKVSCMCRLNTMYCHIMQGLLHVSPEHYVLQYYERPHACVVSNFSLNSLRLFMLCLVYVSRLILILTFTDRVRRLVA
jgi:hypothetical protein